MFLLKFDPFLKRQNLLHIYIYSYKLKKRTQDEISSSPNFLHCSP